MWYPKKYEHLQRERGGARTITLPYIVQQRLARRDQTLVYVPLYGQPENAKGGTRGRVKRERVVVTDGDDPDYALFSRDGALLTHKYILPCKVGKPFYASESFQMFYAADHRCVTDGSCGRQCINDNGHLFCVMYRHDYYEASVILPRFECIEDDLARLFADSPPVASTRMPAELSRLKLTPTRYSVQRYSSIKHIVGNGFKSVAEFERIWRARYPQETTYRLCPGTWMQVVTVQSEIDESHAFDYLGYKSMMERKKSR